MTGSVLLPENPPGTPVQPLVGPGRWRRVAPFAGIGMIGVALTVANPTRSVPALTVALGLVVVLFVATELVPWSRLPVGWQASPAFAFYLLAVLLGYSSEQYPHLSFLTALPIIWLALYHTRRLMYLGLAVLAVALFAPLLLFPDSFDDVALYLPVMTLALSSLGGLAGQTLVSRARSAAAEARAAAHQARADRDLITAYLDTAACLVVALERSGKVVLFNRFAEQVSGYPARELLGGPGWHLGRDRAGDEAVFRKVLAGWGPADYEADLITRTGALRRIAWTATGLVDEAGEVSHVISTGVDITEQREAERLFANVLAAATEQMIMATDIEGNFTVFNAGAERLLGYRAEEMVGVRNVASIHLPEELQAAAEEVGVPDFQTLLTLGSPPEELIVAREWTFVRKDGSTFPAAMTVTMMKKDDRPIGYVLVAEDITERRRAQAAMEQALQREREAADRLRELDQVKSDFVATVSHDLRTPLTSITGNTELLLDGDAGELAGMQRRLLEAVDRNARRLDTLVGDLLLLSRIESGTLRLHPRDVSVQEIIDGALETLAAKQSPDITIEVQRPDEPVLLRADPDQLERVFTNLLSNALKFTPPGGRVTMRVDAGPEQVSLAVSDTGIGIPESELPHIFDRFFRSSRSQEKNRPGSGLGLTIAKSIVDQHRGSIVAGANPDGGTTFTVTLPALAASDTSAREPA